MNLTKQQLRVLELVTVGLTNLQIASILERGERTVQTHVYNLQNKLYCSNRTQIAVYALLKEIVSKERITYLFELYESNSLTLETIKNTNTNLY